MIKITFHSIDLGADISSFGDGTFDLDHLYVLDSNGHVYEELPASMLTEKADGEIIALIQQALDAQEPDCDGPDLPYYPEYRIGPVNC